MSAHLCSQKHYWQQPESVRDSNVRQENMVHPLNRILLSLNKGGILTPAATQINLEDTVLSEISQSHKDSTAGVHLHEAPREAKFKHHWGWQASGAAGREVVFSGGSVSWGRWESSRDAWWQWLPERECQSVHWASERWFYIISILSWLKSMYYFWQLNCVFNVVMTIPFTNSSASLYIL